MWAPKRADVHGRRRTHTHAYALLENLPTPCAAMSPWRKPPATLSHSGISCLAILMKYDMRACACVCVCVSERASVCVSLPFCQSVCLCLCGPRCVDFPLGICRWVVIHLTPPDPQRVNEYEHTPAQYKQSLELAAVHGGKENLF